MIEDPAAVKKSELLKYQRKVRCLKLAKARKILQLKRQAKILIEVVRENARLKEVV